MIGKFTVPGFAHTPFRAVLKHVEGGKDEELVWCPQMQNAKSTFYIYI